MPPRKKLLRGWSQITTERSLLMRRLPFVSIQTGTMDFRVRPCRRHCMLYISGYMRYLGVGSYGFTSHHSPSFLNHNIAELSKEQRAKLQKSKRISNPGCYPTGFIALTKPLVDAGIIPVGTPLTVNAISGYSGGGKALMNLYETEEHEPWGTYGLNLAHKHVPEMSKVRLLKSVESKTHLYAGS